MSRIAALISAESTLLQMAYASRRAACRGNAAEEALTRWTVEMPFPVILAHFELIALILRAGRCPCVAEEAFATASLCPSVAQERPPSAELRRDPPEATRSGGRRRVHRAVIRRVRRPRVTSFVGLAYTIV